MFFLFPLCVLKNNLGVHLVIALQKYYNAIRSWYTYNVCNSIHLIRDLQTMKRNKYMWLCSFDIENIYNNIPKQYYKHN
jgi:hypothetical protein